MPSPLAADAAPSLPPPTTTSSLQLRLRSGRDAEDLFELFNQRSVLESALMRDPFSSVEEVNLWLSRFAAPKRVELVTVCDDHCVGFGAVYGLNDHFDHCGAIMLAVKDAFRGRGIGGRLLAALLRTARQPLGLRKLQLTVLTENQEAIGFYQRHGFDFEGRHRRFARRGDSFVDAYSMAIELDPPHAS
jgi:putative acetyltransferase